MIDWRRSEVCGRKRLKVKDWMFIFRWNGDSRSLDSSFLFIAIVVACDDDDSNDRKVHSQEYPHQCFSRHLNHGEQL